MKQMERNEDLAAAALLLLPEDVLADVLGRLPPRLVAASRCVCKTWRDIVDGHRLLRLDLPHTVDSIILNLYGLKSSRFLTRPTRGSAASADLDRTVSGKLDHLHDPSAYVSDHCNGLLIIHDCVVNPATGQLARLPKCPFPSMGASFYTNKFLAFDPVVSPYYEVFAIPRVRNLESFVKFREPAIENLEWPPPQCILHVFSSWTGRWEEKSFVREGEAAGIVAGMRADSKPRKRHAVYWQGALYAHCENNFVMRVSSLSRISLSNGKYRVIKPVQDMMQSKYPNIYLGRSEHGVYCAIVKLKILRVWLLSRQPHGQMGWVLKHTSDLCHVLPPLKYDFQRGDFRCVLPPLKCDGNGPWTLHRAEAYKDHIVEPVWDHIGKIDRDPDSGADIDLKDRTEKHYCDYTTLLGFHPYEEVIFLGARFRRGLGYNLNDFTTQELGDLCSPFYQDTIKNPYIDASFVYTPCLIGKFPENS
ncbi:hypothetical protein ACQ4PT_018510 [Festuca glaucescens]